MGQGQMEAKDGDGYVLPVSWVSGHRSRQAVCGKRGQFPMA